MSASGSASGSASSSALTSASPSPTSSTSGAADPLYASVDVGGTTIGIALGHDDGRVVVEHEFPTESHRGPIAVLDRIGQEVARLAAEHGQPLRLGIGLPGIVDAHEGVSKFLPNMPSHWLDVPVAAPLAAAVGCPVRVLNDVRQHTMGELAYGHGRGRDRLTMVYLGLGTGIGGGVVIDGELHLGPLGAAGEIGHITVLPSGSKCGCGNRGCLETLASGPAITASGVRLLTSGQADHLHQLVGGDAGEVNPKNMTQAALAGDEAIAEAIAHAGEAIGLAMSSLVLAVHPELIVIGGGVSLIGDLLFDAVRETLRQRVQVFPVDDIAVVPSKLAEDAGLLGGLASAAFGTRA